MTHGPESKTVLVTGASGFIASHCVLRLLQAGYAVRGTLRDPAREDGLREALAKDVEGNSKLEFVIADLLEDKGWNEAAQGCEYALHIASPLPPGPPKHEDELIIPARDGTLRVLRAAEKAGIRRVVITSSIAAIIAGHKDYTKTFDENDWTNLDGGIGGYAKSKTLAERAAWNFVNNTRDLELSVINPGIVLGPSIDGRSFSTAGALVSKLMLREVPGSSGSKFLIVDVRDVAAAHLTAMTSEAAGSRRYIAVSSGRWTREVALVLEEQFAERGYGIPTRPIPDFAVRLVALFDETVNLVVDSLGQDLRASTERIASELDWKGREPEETIIATAESMIAHGIV